MWLNLIPRRTACSGAILRWHVIGREIRRCLGHSHGLRVLDVGCGRGEYAIVTAEKLSSVQFVLGIDEMKRDSAGPFLSVPKALCGRVRFIDGRFSAELVERFAPFDAAICVDVLEHIGPDRLFLTDIAKVTKPGGLLILHVPATPQMHPIPSVRRRLEWLLESGSGQHVREGYTVAQLRAALNEAGWSMKRARRTFGPLAALWSDLDVTLTDFGRAGLVLRIILLPMTVLGALLASLFEPKRGNGWFVLAMRR
jgi:SAM-dependent methyltransferase